MGGAAGTAVCMHTACYMHLCVCVCVCVCACVCVCVCVSGTWDSLAVLYREECIPRSEVDMSFTSKVRRLLYRALCGCDSRQYHLQREMYVVWASIIERC